MTKSLVILLETLHGTLKTPVDRATTTAGTTCVLGCLPYKHDHILTANILSKV